MVSNITLKEVSAALVLCLWVRCETQSSDKSGSLRQNEIFAAHSETSGSLCRWAVFSSRIIVVVVVVIFRVIDRRGFKRAGAQAGASVSETTESVIGVGSETS